MKVHAIIPFPHAWHLVLSLVAGLLVVWWWVAFGDGSDPSDFESVAILQRLLIGSSVSFLALLLLGPVSRWLRGPLRWLFTWQTIKRGLGAFVGLLLVIALVHVEEDWRGGRAWESFKREWEAKGERFDFASYVPPPVPDEQNFALTPIVASCYSHVLDRNGHRIMPEATNVVNRLEMELCRRDMLSTSNMWFHVWRESRFTDLKAWQDHYRATSITNVTTFPDAAMLAAVATRYGIKTIATNESPVAIQPPSTVSVRALATNEFPIAPQPQSPAADVLLALSKYAPAIEELRQASRLPYSRFPLNYSAMNPGEIHYPHYETLKAVASVLRLRAVAELSDGQIQTAWTDVRLILYLANSVRGEPREWSLRRRLEIVEYAIQPIWEGLARWQWSEAQLVALAGELSRFDALRDYNHAVRADLAWNLKVLDSMRLGRMTNAVVCMCGDPMFWPTLAIRLSPSGWYYLNKVTAARRSLEALSTRNELARGILPPDISRRLASLGMSEHKRRLIPDHWPMLSFIHSPERCAPVCARVQTAVDLARVAIALERYRRATESFPTALGDLSPDFLQSVPHDIVTGEPLHYRRTDDGQFLLYSVAWDGRDDGGEPANSMSYVFPNADTSTGDWVWRYPQN